MIITHEEAKQQVSSIPLRYSVGRKVNLFQYIAQNEQRDRDVARYLELLRKMPKHSFEDYNEWCDLNEKLSKVGKE